MRRAGLFTINVYSQIFEQLKEARKIEILRPQYAILTDLSIYDDEKGLLENFEEGASIFF